MKVEIGESLVYSWLRHVKECRLVQMNWKLSPTWSFSNQAEVEAMFFELNDYFSGKVEGNVFKKTSSVDQLLLQGECDVLGISAHAGTMTYYAVDVAFHEAGLNYGSKNVTVLKVLAKCIRTAFCLITCFDTRDGHIIFASPKITPALTGLMYDCFDMLNCYFQRKGYGFDFILLCNDDFEKEIVRRTLQVSRDVADTSELFMRGYQLLDMFFKKH